MSQHNGVLSRPRRTFLEALRLEITQRWGLYLLLLPTLVYVAIFLYGPMGGVIMAFQDYKVAKGFLGSTFVGFKHFERFIMAYNFWEVMKNTIVISLYSLIAGFPLPIIFALLLNSLRGQRSKNFIKTVAYAPHFISVIVIVSMINLFFAPTSGVIANVVNFLQGSSEPVVLSFLTSPKAFPSLYVWSGIWQELGWGSIIYLAALSAISPDQYEAAEIDGASRFQILINIDIPAIMPTMVTLLILNTGRLLSVGFEKAYLMQNNRNIEASEIVSTYVYKMGLNNAQYSYSTAVGLFNNVINMFMLIIVNQISRKLADVSIW